MSKWFWLLVGVLLVYLYEKGYLQTWFGQGAQPAAAGGTNYAATPATAPVVNPNYAISNQPNPGATIQTSTTIANTVRPAASVQLGQLPTPQVYNPTKGVWESKIPSQPWRGYPTWAAYLAAQRSGQA
ncbi:MAG: hypothetical protein ABSA41_12530 [Terriglobia bacterium]|jgi:hypothetical protein